MPEATNQMPAHRDGGGRRVVGGGGADGGQAHPDADEVHDDLGHQGGDGAGEDGPPGHLVEQHGTRVGLRGCRGEGGSGRLDGHSFTPGLGSFEVVGRRQSVAGARDEQAEAEADGAGDQQGGEGVLGDLAAHTALAMAQGASAALVSVFRVIGGVVGGAAHGATGPVEVILGGALRAARPILDVVGADEAAHGLANSAADIAGGVGDVLGSASRTVSLAGRRGSRPGRPPRGRAPRPSPAASRSDRPPRPAPCRRFPWRRP